MSLDVLANKWRAFKEAVKRLWNDYLEYYSQNGWFMDPISEDLFIYQYLLEEEEDRKWIDSAKKYKR